MTGEKSLDDVVITDIDNRTEAHFKHENIVKLKKATVLVNGSDTLAQFVLANMVGLGIGNIYFMDNRRKDPSDRNDFLCAGDTDNDLGSLKVRSIESQLKKINPNSTIKGINSRFSELILKEFGLEPDLILDATNSEYSKKTIFQYCREQHLPFISASSNEDLGLVSCYHPEQSRTMRDAFDKLNISRYGMINQHQGTYSSSVAAGLAVEEVRKNLFKIRDNDTDNPIGNKDMIVYNLNNHDKNSPEDDLRKIGFNYFANKNALIVGAGAVGNFVALNLGMLGFGNIDIIDNDDIELTNLNRQIAFCTDDMGKNKAMVLSQRVRELSRGSVNPFEEWFDTSNEYLFSKGNGHGRYDIVFCCVDTWKTRKLLNDYAVKYSVPLIEGGCSPTQGKVTYYLPGKTYCLECVKGLSVLAENERKLSIEQELDQSCVHQINPSIVMPNVIVAGLMVGEAKRLLYSNNSDYFVQGQIAFRSLSRKKLGIDPLPAYMNEHICQEK